MRCASPPESVPLSRFKREITEADLDQKLQARLDLAHDIGHDRAAAVRVNAAGRMYSAAACDRQFAELVDVQLATFSILDRDRQNLRLQTRAAADFARHARHESADAIARELALGLLVEPLHLRDQPFERLRRFVAFRCRRSSSRSADRRCRNKRLLELVRQIRERHVFIDAEMLHERVLQLPVISLHPFRPAAPRRDRSFRERLLSGRKSSARHRRPAACRGRDTPGTRRDGC